jgi:DNA-binding FrmR family transcriptional regulator
MILKTNKPSALTNFKKAQTSLNNVIKMIEDKEYCIDIMQQNLAIIGLLKSAHQMLMENHLKSCFTNAMSTSNERKKKDMIEEILTVTKISNR